MKKLFLAPLLLMQFMISIGLTDIYASEMHDSLDEPVYEGLSLRDMFETENVLQDPHFIDDTHWNAGQNITDFTFLDTGLRFTSVSEGVGTNDSIEQTVVTDPVEHYTAVRAKRHNDVGANQLTTRAFSLQPVQLTLKTDYTTLSSFQTSAGQPFNISGTTGLDISLDHAVSFPTTIFDTVPDREDIDYWFELYLSFLELDVEITSGYYFYDTGTLSIDFYLEAGLRNVQITMHEINKQGQRTDVIFTESITVEGPQGQETFTYDFNPDDDLLYELDIQFNGGVKTVSGMVVPFPQTNYATLNDDVVALDNVAYNQVSDTNLHNPNDPVFYTIHDNLILFHLLIDSAETLRIHDEMATHDVYDITLSDFTDYSPHDTRYILPLYLNHIPDYVNDDYPFTPINITEGYYTYVLEDNQNTLYPGQNVLVITDGRELIDVRTTSDPFKDTLETRFRVLYGLDTFLNLFAVGMFTSQDNETYAPYDTINGVSIFRWPTTLVDDFETYDGALVTVNTYFPSLFSGIPEAEGWYQYEYQFTYDVENVPPITDRVNEWIAEIFMGNSILVTLFMLVVFGAVTVLLALKGAPFMVMILMNLILMMLFTLFGLMPMWIMLVIGILLFGMGVIFLWYKR